MTRKTSLMPPSSNQKFAYIWRRTVSLGRVEMPSVHRWRVSHSWSQAAMM